VLLVLGCRPRPTGPGVYGPWEEGLTLAFEDPSLPTPEARAASHYQLRVFKGLTDPTKPGVVKLTENTLQNSYTYAMQYEAGGRALLGEDGKLVAWILPQGFPDQVQAWADAPRGFTFRLIGRAAWAAPFKLPATVDTTGLWVETERKDGLKRRGLYLQGLGEVESMEWRDGRWVTVNRLVARGFTDLPAQGAR
jgi:hypothetical protein